MPIHNKLVRDKIPEIIESTGKKAYCHILFEEEYLSELDKKLNEECAEYQADKSLEELADYVSHEGSKPMNVVWKLREPIPAKYIKRTNKLVV